jgi:flagellar biosynthetic protein FlhB
MAQNDPSRRTLAATPQQRRRFREQGRMPHSILLAPAAALLALPLVALLLTSLASTAESVMTAGLTFNAPLEGLGSLTAWAAPLLVGPLLVALALFVWQGVVVTVPFKVQGLNPATQLRRIFSRQSLGQAGVMLLALAGLLLLAAVGVPAVLPGMGFNLTQGISAGPAVTLLPTLLGGAGAVGLVLLVVAGMTARARFERDLRMTPEEFREDLKANEGDPHVRRRWAQLRRSFYQTRLREAVRRADVVLVNPTHYAVALAYEPWKTDAPVLVAKGRAHRALRIRELAAELAVPVVESPPLARDLFHSVREDEAIPSRLYRAVAEVLAYLYRVHGYRPRRGPEEAMS